MPSGRLRFAILAATVAAFLLVPAAQAAAGTLKVKVVGTGSGEVLSEFGFEAKGTPPIECSYSSPGPATGICENTMSVNGGKESVDLLSVAGSGSDVGSVTIQKGKDINEEEIGEPGYGCNEASGQAELEGAFGGWLCIVEGAGGSPSAEVTVCFVLEGEGEAGCEGGSPPVRHITVFKTGEGTVVASPGGECTPAQNPCLFEFELNEMVTLTASPATGYAFSAWAGCTEHVGLTCKAKMEKATVKVTFVATPSLTIEKAGSGSGKVAATGISCDESCSKETAAVKTGTSVTVKTTPAKGSEAAVLEGGTGSAGACSGSTCIFTISENSSLKVKFDPKPTKTLTVDLTGPGAYKGKVTGKGIAKGLYGLAINCGAGCTTQTESFFSADTVTLTATTAAGYTFAGWSLLEGSDAGTCTGATSPCTVPTSSSKTLAAEFK
jgi:hypothetical protein